MLNTQGIRYIVVIFMKNCSINYPKDYVLFYENFSENCSYYTFTSGGKVLVLIKPF